MIEKILEMLREASRKDIFDKQDYILLRDANKIVQKAAKEYAEIARESREDFMEIVYSELEEDADNNRANRIIDAFDTYAPYQREVAKEYDRDTNDSSNEWIPVETELPKEHLWAGHMRSEEVFVTFLDNNEKLRVDTDNTYDGKWHYYGDRVIAWMQKNLPAPYQKGE